MTRRLSVKQIKAARMVAEGNTPTAISTALTLRRGTMGRWRRQPEFRREVEDVAYELRESMFYKLLQTADAAIINMQDGMKEGQSDSETRPECAGSAANGAKRSRSARRHRRTAPNAAIMCDNAQF